MSRSFRVLVALWFLALVNYLERVAMGFAGPSVMQTMHLTPGQFGLVLSSFGVGYLFAQIPGGMLADRWGARTLLTIGPLFWALFTGMTGLVSSLVALVVVRVCFGFSEGFSNPSVYNAIGENFEPRQRARSLGIVSTAIPLAPAFAGAAIGSLIAARGWQSTFLILAIPSLLVSVSCYLMIPSKTKAAASPARIATTGSEARFRDVLKRPSLWILSLGAFAMNIPYWGFMGWMPSYLSIAHHIDLKSIGALGSLIYVFAFVGLLVGGSLGSTIFEKKCAQLIAISFGGAGISLGVAYLGQSMPVVLAGLSSAAFFLFGMSGPFGKMVLDLAPEKHRASYVGTYNVAGHLGGALAPAVIGWLVGTSGTFAAGFSFMIAALAVAAICIIALIPYLNDHLSTVAGQID